MTISYFIRLREIVDLETGNVERRGKWTDNCVLSFKPGGQMEIHYTERDSVRTTSKCRKVYDKYDRWPGGYTEHFIVVRTQNSEYRFEQACVRSDYDDELFNALADKLANKLATALCTHAK